MSSRDSFLNNWDRNGYDYAAAALKKAQNTRELKRAALTAKKAADRQRKDEDASAEDWYEERTRKEAEWAAFHAARQRQDHLLPEEDQLPF